MRYKIVSQEPRALINPGLSSDYLAKLLDLTNAIEKETKHRWHVTSYIRNSPSHKSGLALDIAPDILPRDAHSYGVFMHSDPVLYKRVPMLRSLQKVASNYAFTDYDVGIFIEPDHLHLQLFKPRGTVGEIRIMKWKDIKPVYPDSFERSKLPLFN